MRISWAIRSLVICVVCCLSASGQGDTTPRREIIIQTIPEKMRFDVEWIAVKPSEKIKLTFRNNCRMQHNLVLCQPGYGITKTIARMAWNLGSAAIEKNYVPDHSSVISYVPIVSPGESFSLELTAPAVKGDYPFVCTLPGHSLTMKGILHVGSLNDTPPPIQASTDSLPHSAVTRAKQKMKQYRHNMENGPVLSGIIFSGGTKMIDGTESGIKTTHRGLIIRSGRGQMGHGNWLFDTELMRFTAGWQGRMVEFMPGREDERAEYRYRIGANLNFASNNGTGWLQRNGSWSDPRPKGLGQIAVENADFHGYHIANERIILEYSILGSKILDYPWMAGDHTFIRHLHISPGKEPKVLRLAPIGSINAGIKVFSGMASLSRINGYHIVTIPPQSAKSELVVSLSHKDIEPAKYLDLESLVMYGNRGMAPPSIMTKGTLAEVDESMNQAYVVDTLTLPWENPWNSILYTSGHDFYDNGDAAVCTSHGEVWKVSGIDSDLDRLEWTRIAHGLANPLGLRIVNDTIYVTTLAGLIRLVDNDHDGLTDFYHYFNDDIEVSNSHHRFATDLQTDSKGNFYYLKCTDEGNTDHGGTMVRVSSDGQIFELFATGLRNPNGMSIGPNDMITFGKQQGGWIPSSGIHVVREGGFYGYIPSHHRNEQPTSFDPPLTWIPHGIDNSSGGQAWAPEDSRWGPLAGNLLHFSYGRCRMFLVLKEQIEGVWQGGVIEIPGIHFESGAMRGRFRQQDGQLYVTGLRGWQTSAAMPGCLQRVRYTGNASYLPKSMNITPRGITLSFHQKLNPESARSTNNFKLSQWQYEWSRHYGSKDFRVSDPDSQGRDEVNISRSILSSDRRSVTLEIPDLQPVMQMAIQYNLSTHGGRPVKGSIFNTVNRVPKTADNKSNQQN